MDSEALTGAFRRTAQVGHKDSVPMLAVVDCLRAEADDEESGQLKASAGILGEFLAYAGDGQKVQDHEDLDESETADNFPRALKNYAAVCCIN
ncbi:hypothetical protein WN943_014072 [Citrus x changshan-huyou]